MPPRINRLQLMGFTRGLLSELRPDDEF
jgi:hypothetical protein